MGFKSKFFFHHSQYNNLQPQTTITEAFRCHSRFTRRQQKNSLVSSILQATLIKRLTVFIVWMIITFYKRVQFRVFWVFYDTCTTSGPYRYQNIIELFPRSCQKVGCYGYWSCSYCRWSDISLYWISIGTTVEFGVRITPRKQ